MNEVSACICQPKFCQANFCFVDKKCIPKIHSRYSSFTRTNYEMLVVLQYVVPPKMFVLPDLYRTFSCTTICSSPVQHKRSSVFKSIREVVPFPFNINIPPRLLKSFWNEGLRKLVTSSVSMLGLGEGIFSFPTLEELREHLRTEERSLAEYDRHMVQKGYWCGLKERGADLLKGRGGVALNLLGVVVEVIYARGN